MLFHLLSLFFGLALLIWSADFFVGAAVKLARCTGVPPLIVGMLVVGFGTSTPELLVSAVSAFQGNPGLALGNAYGSNVANIGLILGLGALVRPLRVHSGILRRELPVLLGVTLLSWGLLTNGSISRIDAGILLTVFFVAILWLVRMSMGGGGDPLLQQVAVAANAAKPRSGGPGRIFAEVLVGLAGLIISSRALVWGAVGIAEALGVGDLLIGLTVVALGTSLPELAATLAAVRKGEDDLILGNIVGSNLFNTLGVVGLAGVIHPLELGAEVLRRDFPVVTVMTLAVFVVGVGIRGPGRINRVEGACLVAAYIGYMVWLILPVL